MSRSVPQVGNRSCSRKALSNFNSVSILAARAMATEAVQEIGNDSGCRKQVVSKMPSDTLPDRVHGKVLDHAHERIIVAAKLGKISGKQLDVPIHEPVVFPTSKSVMNLI